MGAPIGSHLLLKFSVAAFLLGPSLYWVFHDQSVWPWDMAWYAEVSLDLWAAVESGPLKWWTVMTSAFGTKAPGIAWLGQLFVPLRGIVGGTEIALLLSVIGAQLVTLVLCYGLAERLSNGTKGLAIVGCFVVGSAPLFVAMSHQYLTEALQLLGVTYFYWIAAQSNTWPPIRTFGHLSLATGISLLAKASSPLYCVLPGVLAVYDMWKTRHESTRTSLANWPEWIPLGAGLLTAIGAAIWYRKNLAVLREFMVTASSGDIALDYGHKDTFLNKLHYWTGACQKSAMLPEVLLIVGAVCVAALAISSFPTSRRNCVSIRSARLNVLGALAVLQITLVLLVLSLNINEEQRYLLPLLPSVLVIVLWSAAATASPWAWATILCAAGWQWGTVHAQALGLISPRSDMSHWVRRLSTDHSQRDEVERAVRETCNSRSEGRYNVVGVELPWFNYNTLAFYAAKHVLSGAPGCQYVYLGHAEMDLERAWGRLNYYRPVYFLSVAESAQPTPPDFLNQTSIAVLNRVRNDPEYVAQPIKSEKVLIFANREEFAKPLRLRLKDAQIIDALTPELRARYGVDYETVVMKGLEQVWLHPLPPEARRRTTVALTVNDVPLELSSNQHLSVGATIAIENAKSEPVTFSMEVWSGPGGRGVKVGQTVRTVRPSDGEVEIVVNPVIGEPFRSIVLSTEMAMGAKNNWNAHARFSDIGLRNRQQ
jgi:hypothetical protein